MQFDVFISHASEDKVDFVEPLAQALKIAGVKVWYDNFVLEWGDTLRGTIDRGLSDSRFGIVVLSPAFLKRKRWTEHELDGLFAREHSGDKVILPIWHKVTQDDLAAYSPSFADRLAKNSETDSIDNIVAGVKRLLAAAVTNAEPDAIHAQGKDWQDDVRIIRSICRPDWWPRIAFGHEDRLADQWRTCIPSTLSASSLSASMAAATS